MRGVVTKLPPKYYEMPSRYKDCFYLANSSFYDIVNWYLHKAYEVVFPELVEELMNISGLDEKQASGKVLNLIEILDQCNDVLDVRFPVRRKNDYLDLIRCFKVTHGAYTGFPSGLLGLRLSPKVSRDDLKGLGVLSTHRLSAFGIKNPGVFGAIKIDPNNYETEEIREIMKQFSLKCFKGENTEGLFIEPDMNSDGAIMGSIYQELEDDHQSRCLAASQGAFFGINHFLNNALITSKLEVPKGILGKTFIIQGIGLMGSNLAVYLQNAGAKCVGVKDHNCHVYKKEGLDMNEIISFKNDKGDLIGYDMAKPTDNFEIYKEDCDLLILAARQKSLLCHFAKSIKAKMIVEAAYHPVTPSAYMTLRGHSKIVLPDLLVCGGMAIAANEESFERRLTKAEKCEIPTDQFQIVPETLLEAIKESRMEENTSTYTVANVISNMSEEVLNTCEKYNLGFDFKTAVFIISIRNIFEEIFSSRRF